MNENIRKNEWTEAIIQDKLIQYFLSGSTKKYEVCGKFIYSWESDYLAFTKSGYVYECEIKISRTDFFNDSKKVQKHLILESKETKKQRPNYFYYAVPKDLIDVDEVPDGYGLIYVNEYGIEIVKKSEKIHGNKFDSNKLNLIDKFYYAYKDARELLGRDEYRKEIKRLNRDIEVYDNLLSEANCKIEEYKIMLSKQ